VRTDDVGVRAKAFGSASGLGTELGDAAHVGDECLR
jgi:hypothetical protein